LETKGWGETGLIGKRLRKPRPGGALGHPEDTWLGPGPIGHGRKIEEQAGGALDLALLTLGEYSKATPGECA